MKLPEAAASPLTPTTAAALLSASAAAVAAEVRALSPDLARRRPDDGGWCALEVVGHLLEAERRGFAGRIRQLLDQDQPQLESWDQSSVAEGRRDCEREVEPLLRELLAERERSVQLLEALQPGDLRRAGEHPVVGRLTIGEVMHEWVHHDRAHVQQVLAISQRLAWPHMGNAQRFSE